MRRAVGLLIVLSLLACKGESPTQTYTGLTTAPPTLYPTATLAVLVTGGFPVLEVTVTLHNYTPVHLQAVVSTTCPFAEHIFPDSSGAYAYIGVVGCPAGGVNVDVAPGDSTILRKMIGADTLGTFAPGMYGVDILVGTVSGSIGAWAGAVRLPLTPPPPPHAARRAAAQPPAR